MNLVSLVVDGSFLWRALLATSLSFLIGLEFHNYQRVEGQGLGFGTTRTLTLIGIAGFLLAALDASGTLFALGLLTITAWLALYYRERLKERDASLMAPMIGLLVYLLGLLAGVAPQWFVTGYAIFIIFFLNAKPSIRSFADTFSGQEVATVAKFVIMAGIVLPLLPDRQIAPFTPVTFRDTWFAVVAISGISYLSYVLKTYVFKLHGVLAAGLLGGLYSSTAVTLVLGRQAQGMPGSRLTSPAMMLATAMMYVRLMALTALLVPASLMGLAPPFMIAAALSCVAAVILIKWRAPLQPEPAPAADKHPLEFQAALLFAMLFVIFGTAAEYVMSHYSDAGLEVAAFAIGFTEIDHFVLSVLSGHLGINLHTAVDAVVVATASNNLLKAGLAFGLARNRSVVPACIWLVTLAGLSFAYVAL